MKELRDKLITAIEALQKFLKAVRDKQSAAAEQAATVESNAIYSSEHKLSEIAKINDALSAYVDSVMGEIETLEGSCREAYAQFISAFDLNDASTINSISILKAAGPAVPLAVQEKIAKSSMECPAAVALMIPLLKECGLLAYVDALQRLQNSYEDIAGAFSNGLGDCLYYSKGVGSIVTHTLEEAMKKLDSAIEFLGNSANPDLFKMFV